jgi:hypothetical protein
MSFQRVFTGLSRYFRKRRMERFAREFALTNQTRVLDVGGTPDCWNLLNTSPRVAFLNVPEAADMAGAGLRIAGDGRALPFRDGAFDLVFSNSVIEHVGDEESQRRFASEVARVGRGYWVQTPNHWFPVEQHMLTPFLHWLPKAWQRAIAPRWTVWSAFAKPTPDRRRFYVEHYLNEMRLLNAAELRALFPAARLIRERACGLTKSLVAMKRG